jgi:hypothetical protein
MKPSTTLLILGLGMLSLPTTVHGFLLSASQTSSSIRLRLSTELKAGGIQIENDNRTPASSFPQYTSSFSAKDPKGGEDKDTLANAAKNALSEFEEGVGFQYAAAHSVGDVALPPKVEDTVTKFIDTYARPIIPVYREVVNDIIQNAHVTCISDRTFKYTPFWALGYTTLFDSYFKGYPVSGEGQRMAECLASALGFSYATLVADAEKATSWASGKKVEDYFTAIKEGGDELANALKGMKENEDLVINDYFISLGLCKTVEAMGGDLAYEATPAYFEALGFLPEKGQNDYDEFDLSVRKLNQIETLMKAVEIREKKKMADRLEEKAKKAAAAAEAAAQDEISTEPDLPSPATN